MTTQKLSEMQPFPAALAIFAALPAEFGIAHKPDEHDRFGYCYADIGAIPGALLRLTMRSDSSTGRGMFRASISDSLPPYPGMTYGDFMGIELPAGNFTRDQGPEKAAQAIARRLLSNGAAAGYIAACIKRREDKLRAVQHAENAVALFGASVQAECKALGATGVFVNFQPAGSSGARDVAYTGSFFIKLWGGGKVPGVTLSGAGPNMPVRVRIEDGPTVSFSIAAKICALVALDKSAED